MSHSIAYLVVVGTHIHGIFVTVGPAVEDYHRYSLVVCLLYDRSQGIGRVGRDNEQVNTISYEALYLAYLLLVVIVGRDYVEQHVAVGISSYYKFFVEFSSPCVFAAL